jgi:hypothetical protein
MFRNNIIPYFLLTNKKFLGKEEGCANGRVHGWVEEREKDRE